MYQRGVCNLHRNGQWSRTYSDQSVTSQWSMVSSSHTNSIIFSRGRIIILVKTHNLMSTSVSCLPR